MHSLYANNPDFEMTGRCIKRVETLAAPWAVLNGGCACSLREHRARRGRVST